MITGSYLDINQYCLNKAKPPPDCNHQELSRVIESIMLFSIVGETVPKYWSPFMSFCSGNHYLSIIVRNDKKITYTLKTCMPVEDGNSILKLLRRVFGPEIKFSTCISSGLTFSRYFLLDQEVKASVFRYQKSKSAGNSASNRHRKRQKLNGCRGSH